MHCESIEIGSYAHVNNPLPVAARVGPLLASSIIAPLEPGTRNMPEDPQSQVRNLFHHMGAILDAAEAKWEHIAKITFYGSNPELRKLVNGPWLQQFPDPKRRPARFVNISADGPSCAICEFLAYVEN